MNAPVWSPPPEFDEYRLLEPIGWGRTGRVYLARDLLLERLVAIKFILSLGSLSLGRFLVEARAGARVQHPNVATLYRVGQLDEHPFLVSEYVRGESLDRVRKPMPWERALSIGTDLARGLAAAHLRGVLHRDIKPGNAVLAETGEAKLLDFGLAKLMGEATIVGQVAEEAEAPASVAAAGGEAEPSGAQAGDRLALPSLTHGRLVGTPYYMSPEAWRGEELDARSDIYSLGAVLYELCAGRAPFRHVSAQELGRVVGEEDPVPLGEAGAAVPPRLGQLVDRCLRRDPQQRPASVNELLDALHQITEPRIAVAVPAGTNPYRGLATFEAEHRALFFGRRRNIQAIVERLRGEPLVVVTGDSGVGKSSLCLAGVLPAVNEGALGDQRRWLGIRLVPGRRPLAALAAALAPVLGVEDTLLEEQLGREPAEVTRALRRRLGAAGGLLVYVDQLEELVTVARPSEAPVAGEMLGQLAAGVAGVRVLASVRSDFLTRLAAIPGIGELVAHALYLVRGMQPDELREAIVGPAAVMGGHFESEALVQALVASARDAQGGLPLLQFALAELWTARDPASGTISIRALEEMGGVSGALARHADSEIERMLPHARVAARRMLVRLVTEAHTRARRTAAELGGEGPEGRAVLEALVRGRLVVVRQEEEQTSYEIAHEALVSGWATLGRWLAEERESRALRERLSQATAEWERLGRGRDTLWGARQLAEARGLDEATLTPREAAFLAASQRTRRRTRLLGVGGLFLVLGAALVLYAVAQRTAAQAQAEKRGHALAEIETALGEAHAAVREREAIRRNAFEQYRTRGLKEGNRIWAHSLVAGQRAQRAYSAAGEAFERALALSGDDPEVEARFADYLFERALEAEQARDPALRDVFLQRLWQHDRSREHWRRWNAPARLRLVVRPSGATVTIARYEVDEWRKRRLGPARTLGAAPLAAQTLEPGSYLLTAQAPGRVKVAYPVLLAHGEEYTAELELPPTSAVPEGFVYVPAGRFLFGSGADESIRSFFGAVPIHTVETGAYLIHRTETTYAEWIAYLEALPPAERRLRLPNTGAGALHGVLELHAPRRAGEVWQLTLQPGKVAYTARAGEMLRYGKRDRRAEQDWLRLPVSGISRDDAKAYVTWLDRTGRIPGARLCTEHEWERAARGADDREYPHGDRLDPDDANFDLTYDKQSLGFGPDEVGSHPASRSPFDVDDMVGNVWEWVESSFVQDKSVARGGSYYYAATSCHLTHRETPESTLRDTNVGLRVCANVTPSR